MNSTKKIRNKEDIRDTLECVENNNKKKITKKNIKLYFLYI
jgi:hypothetical protein